MREIRYRFINSHVLIFLSYIASLLGFGVHLEQHEDKRVISILNTDLEGFSGYGEIKIINGWKEQVKILFN